jgi:hypothetical protein
MKYSILFIFFITFNCISQTNDTIINKKIDTIFNFKISLDTTTIKRPNFNYNFRSDTNQSFVIYNKNTQWNDLYDVSKNTASIKPFSFSMNQSTNIDSLNPFGTNNIGAGVIVGVINSIIGAWTFNFK